MTIVNFTPWTAVLGGSLLGFSALALLLISGRIAGISGILAGFLGAKAGDWLWRALFIAGLMLGAALAFGLGWVDVPNLSAPIPLLLLAGLLVGIGAKLGNGCTSGHGICGMGRLSRRSIVATLTFMTTGFITVFVLRHLL